MGLTITAYKNLQPYTEKQQEETHEWLIIRNEETHINWLNPKEEGAFYLSPETKDHNVYYSHEFYNQWCNQLCYMLHRCSPAFFINAYNEPIQAVGPFIELIQLSDCKGWIGPHYTKKLRDDFSTYNLLLQLKLDRLENDTIAQKLRSLNFKQILPYKRISKDEFLNAYNELKQLFEFTEENGYIQFH